jgi:hypothetical protein
VVSRPIFFRWNAPLGLWLRPPLGLWLRVPAARGAELAALGLWMAGHHHREGAPSAAAARERWLARAGVPGHVSNSPVRTALNSARRHCALARGHAFHLISTAPVMLRASARAGGVAKLEVESTSVRESLSCRWIAFFERATPMHGSHSPVLSTSSRAPPAHV